MSRTLRTVLGLLAAVLASASPRPGLSGDRAFRRGDANGDGPVDIVDAARVFDFLFQSGRPLECPDAADPNDDERVDLDDGMWLLRFLFSGESAPRAPYPECGADPTAAPGESLGCAEYDTDELCPDPPRCCPPASSGYVLRFDAPATVFAEPGLGAAFSASVLLDVPAGSAVGGWSVGVAPRGPAPCTLFEATVAGTVAEDAAAAAGGLGFAVAELTGGNPPGAISAVLLSFTEPTVLAPGTHEVLRLEAAAAPAGGGCEPCWLAFADGLSGSGEPTDNLLVERGERVRPRLEAREVLVCPGPAPPRLVPGSAHEVTLRSGPPRSEAQALIRLDLPPAQTAVVTLDAAGPDSEVALYVSCGRPPSVARHELAAAARGRSSQRLVIPVTQNAECYVLAVAHALGGASTVATVSADVAGIALSELFVRTAAPGKGSVLRARIRGGGFSAGTTFRLEPRIAGATIHALSTDLLSSSEARAAFDLDGATPGLYNLVAEDAARGTARLEDALQLRGGDLGARIEVELVLADSYRAGRVRRLVVRAWNRGDHQASSPLLRLRAPPGVVLRLESEDTFAGNTIQFLASDPRGAPGVLPPGARGETSVLFRIDDGGPDDEVLFRVERFLPYRRDRICWDAEVTGCAASIEPPAGIDEASWNAVRGPLRALLGDHWQGYPERLAELAGGVALRGRDPASVVECLRLALREARGEPGAVLTGTLRHADGRPLAGARAAALHAGAPQACAVSDAAGNFAIAELAGGVPYDLAVEGRLVDVEPLTVAPGGVASFFDVVAEPDPEPAALECPGAPPDGLGGPLLPPEELFVTAAEKAVRVIRPVDPNEKDGPSGQGDGGLIPAVETMRYKVRFENLPAATAPAQVVRVADELPSTLDPLTVELGAVGFGDRVASLVPKEEAFLFGGSILPEAPLGYGGFTVVPLDEDAFVAVEADIDVWLGRVEWTFSTVDALGMPIDDDAAGFLPPNTSPPAGEGFAAFTAELRAGLLAGTEIENAARITFDAEAPIETAPYLNTIEGEDFGALKPRNPVPPDGGERPVDLDALLGWERRRATEAYEVFLWKDGDPEPAVPSRPLDALASFRPPLGLAANTAYRWRVITVDRGRSAAGDVWTFRTEGAAGLFVRGDVEPDGTVNITDPIALLGFLFLGGRRPACMEAADANGDGVQDIADAVWILIYLFASGDPPPVPSPRTADYFRAAGTRDCGFDPIEEAAADCAEFPPCRGP